MQETRNNCLGLKKRSTTLHQVLTGKHECRNVTAMSYVAVTRNNCCEFLAFHGITFQSVIKSFFKMPVFGALLWHYCFRSKGFICPTSSLNFTLIHKWNIFLLILPNSNFHSVTKFNKIKSTYSNILHLKIKYFIEFIIIESNILFIVLKTC